MPRTPALKDYDYASWQERSAYCNGIGDCVRIIEGTTKADKVHWLVITYNQRFWSRGTYQYDTLNEAQAKFFLERQKLDERRDKLKNKKWGLNR